jgi:hypothetical protein
VVFTCPDGDLFVQFKNPGGANKRPFLQPNAGVNVIVTAPRNGRTPALRAKNHTNVDSLRYTVVVAKPGSSGNMVWEDPELEFGPDPGGQRLGSKKSAKKKSKAKAKK